MSRRKILRLVRLEIERLASAGTLEPGQKDAIERALRRVSRGLQRRDIKLVQEGAGLLAAALIKK